MFSVAPFNVNQYIHISINMCLLNFAIIHSFQSVTSSLWTKKMVQKFVQSPTTGRIEDRQLLNRVWKKHHQDIEK